MDRLDVEWRIIPRITIHSLCSSLGQSACSLREPQTSPRYSLHSSERRNDRPSKSLGCCGALALGLPYMVAAPLSNIREGRPRTSTYSIRQAASGGSTEFHFGGGPSFLRSLSCLTDVGQVMTTGSRVPTTIRLLSITSTAAPSAPLVIGWRTFVSVIDCVQ